MEESIFDVDGGSSDFEPVIAAKPKAAKKTAAPKAAVKKTAAPKAKPGPKPKTTVPKKRSKKDAEDGDSEDEDVNVFQDESLLEDTPPQAKKVKPNPVKGSHKKPLGDLVNEAIGGDGATDSPQPQKKKRVSEQYQKLTQLEHIIKRPDTYIGSVERTERQMWVYNTVQDSMEFREVSYVPGIFKIFDEILVNAADNKQNDKNMDELRVTIDREKGEVSVWNNGRGIPIEIHSKEKIYIPEMIFGHLLTGSNYDDNEQKVTGGRNGYGAKLCNIFSTEFSVETADSRQKKKYKQTWTNNMSEMGKAKITDSKGEDYTKITFKPDFAKFGMEAMDDDLEALFKRRVYDLAGTCKGVGVKLNGSKLPVRNFKKYIEMYTKAIKKERGEEAAHDTSEIILESPDPRWEIGFTVSDGSFQQVSFVNSVASTSGGTHVNYVADQIVTRLMEIVKKRNKGGATLKPNQIRNHIFIFVNALIVNPAFTSQTKEQLTTKPSQFGSKFQVSEKFMKEIAKTEVINNILHFAQQKADQILKKSDGNKRSRINNPKLTDANKAGTKEGHQCTLILTEGDSAKGLAMAGRSVVGPDLFGVFPLRGKLLNVRDASIDQISKNAEIQNIKNFLGLQHKKVYTDTHGLRYGHLMIMTDQDHDGSHIKGLLINFLQVQFPSLLKLPNFLVEFITPIVKVYKGDPKNPSQARAFYTMPEYETWKEAHKHERGWEHKYYKGLGTSTTEDAQQYFNDLDRHHKEFDTMKDEEASLIELAFSKKKADERKEWLRQFKPGTYLDHNIEKITYTDFVNKELILFSMADNIRSIPSVVDGLKPGQRKVMYACFKRNLKKDMKVAELAGLVSGLTAYHHGEVSLQQTIVGLAQTFVGSNNVNLLEPSGQFGTRNQGGSDSASARYIFTRLSGFARKLFHQADEPLLTYNTDDDRLIEPEVYVPVVPLVLVNGADGIGTGWSSSIPNYNPEDIVDNLRRRMAGEEWKPMQPWFRGFKGEVKETAPDRFQFSGIIRQSGPTEVEITELPIRVWTQDFKDKLEEIIKAEKVPSFIKDYRDYNTHDQVHFIIQMDEKHMQTAVDEGLVEKFKLNRSVATSNLVAFDPEGRITKYANVEAIMDEFYSYRLQLYAKRKEWLLQDMQKDLRRLTNQARFIQMIIDGKLSISKKKKNVLIAELQKLGFDPFPKTKDASKESEILQAGDDEEAEDDSTDASSYDYLLGMALWSLTQERVEKLLKQIGDKEEEIDVLMKKSKEDLWLHDLDEFIAEWKLQLEEEHNRKRNVRKGRRVSKKFATAANSKKTIKKRKGLGDPSDDESDFEQSAPKPKKSAPAAKPAAKTAPKQRSIAAYVAPQPKTNVLKNAMEQRKLYTDGSSDPIEEPETHEARATGAATTVKEDPDFKETVSKPANRQARAVTKKPTNYALVSDSESDNGDGLLADLGDMVKGLPSKSTTDSGSEPRTLFSASASRPSSSHGYKLPTKPAPRDDGSADETDYKMLAPQSSPRRSIMVTTKEETNGAEELDDDVASGKPVSKTAPKKENDIMDLGSDSDVVLPKPIKKAPVKKAAKDSQPKAKKPAAKKAAAAPKKVEQSPVAKAYAKRLAKKKVVDSDDEVDALADDILKSPSASDSDATLGQKPAPRAARRTVATKKAAQYTFDDEEEDDGGFEHDQSSEAFSESE
ncbi:DNA topoisomerase 2 [Elasticomyces elasticus]|uniref:DNA topoisomerase 2 n=1 Tax=Exophiala sideris TaxID=1016849 RepID=A0ABR0JKR2_9EURO|nr:DNA topoisomerase 2 [Elasticomyces elasticus]KAK5035391.1 DNA topoisomerase 2 [Exophiala sideris]KAK5039258.1 DNA topoisomerase 2 [Exophiala sideris]KAK5066315.1 DNA topoisomerase 2 [Exophiala sideris]KAK5186992.1 DNA topoisomerase 2 [Eurotiomycetes sp. CCFEE 6388]